VSGLIGTGLDLQYSADNVSLPSINQVNANGAFVFDATRTSAVTGTVYAVSIANQPTNPAQTCVVVNGSGTVGTADVGDVAVACGTHTVSVTMAGLRQHSAHGIKLQNNGGDDLTFFIDGPRSFHTALPNGSAYNVTIAAQPQTPDQTCTVSNGSGTTGNADVADVVVNCPYPTPRAVGGTITGLTGTGLDLTYFAPNLGVQLGTAAITSTGFAFAASDTSAVNGTSFSISVRVQPSNQTCYFTGPGAIAGTSFVSGTVGNADVTDLNLSCGPVGSVQACAAPTGAGTTHGSITSAQTWTEAGSPHIVPFDINVSAPVTIQECAVVRIVKGGTITVVPTGSLIANGGAGRPVTFEATAATGQAWSSIRNLGGTLSLTHAVVSGGGDPLNTNVAYAGALHMQSPGLAGTLHLDDVEIVGSLSQGVYINGPVGFDATSQNLRVHGSAGFPVHVYARVIGSIPSGDYTGNARDEIGIAGAGGPVLDAQTLHNRGVPYHVGSGQDGGRMDINSQHAGQVAVLTIEPGVTMRFPPGGTLSVDPASGTAAAQGALIRDRRRQCEDRVHLGPAGSEGGRLARHRLRRHGRPAQRDAKRARRVRRRRGHRQQLVPVPRSGRSERRRGPHLRATAVPVHHQLRDPVERARRHRPRLARRPAARLPDQQHLHVGRRVQADDAAHLQRRVPRAGAVPVKIEASAGRFGRRSFDGPIGRRPLC